MSDREPFHLAWTPTARRNLRPLPEKVASAVVEFVYGPLSESPDRLGHRLRFELEGSHSANRGDYRILYEIDHNDRVVTILAVDHRSKIYRAR